jgi:acetyl/propionyl-CoA carboxylase alpha subunit
MKHRLFRKVLVANRGEIAIRVMRACREMGIQSVAIYSDADADAIHRRYADEAHRIGEAPPAASYLQLEKIVKLAGDAGAQAIHPGYGFLSERPEFPEACAAAGIAFIGPPASAMRAIGSKLEARALAVRHGVPVTPGSDALEDPEEAARVAREIGFPVIVKPSGGGGGIGMRWSRRRRTSPRPSRAAATPPAPPSATPPSTSRGTCATPGTSRSR